MYHQIQSIKTEEGKLGKLADASNQAVILKSVYFKIQLRDLQQDALYYFI